jgi:hypothetical protein
MLAVHLVFLCTARAQAPDGERDGAWELSVAPADVLYRPYVADPRRPVFGLTMIDARESDIDSAGDRRYGIRMGARFGILQLHPQDEPSGGLQLAGEVGFLGQFDRDNSTDNLGWDGLYGFHLAWLARPRLVLRLGMAHDSSHLGDEYIENTGRRRIEYTREELLAGMRYALPGGLSSYLEYGHAYDLRNEDLMEEGRVQLGLEIEPEPMLWNRRLAPFAAFDVSVYEEDDWEENLCVQLGVVRPGAGRVGSWRVGLEYYDGRSPIGEFFQDRERHMAWGLWLDL